MSQIAQKNDQNETSQFEGMHFLVELRARLIRALIVLLAVFAVLLFFANPLYTLLARPLLKFLPEGRLIATQIVSPFFVPFKLALTASMMLSVPIFLQQLWGFIAPALYGHERQRVWPFLTISILLFYSGILFAYFIIFPMLFHFLAQTAPSGVTLAPDISEYLDFTTKLLLTFGLLFEIPMAMVLLVSLNVVSRQTLIYYRSYAVVGSFVIAMFLAPPDVLSQTILAIPIWLLYELGVLMASFVRSVPYVKTV